MHEYILFFFKKDTSQLCVVYQKVIINIKTYIHYRERKRDVNLMVIKRKVVDKGSKEHERN